MHTYLASSSCLHFVEFVVEVSLFFFFVYLTGKVPVPEINLGFAVAAGSVDADGTFKFMKDTIKSIVREYDPDKINYGLIIFGDTAIPRIRFGDFSDTKSLLNVISILPRQRRGAALDEALKEAQKMFKSSGVLPHARNVLVIITDLASGKSYSDLKAAVKPLEAQGVDIVAVAIGKEADAPELENVAPKEKIIEADKTDKPDELQKEIMEKVLTSVYSCKRRFY